MPMLELFVTAGALPTPQRDTAMQRLTSALLKWEGAPESDGAKELSWGYVHETAPDGSYHAGRAADPSQPRYRLMVTVPQGALDDERKAGLVAEATAIILDAEGARADDLSAATRVWVIVEEVTDGNWGGAGRIWRLRDIARFVAASAERTEEAAAGMGSEA